VLLEQDLHILDSYKKKIDTAIGIYEPMVENVTKQKNNAVPYVHFSVAMKMTLMMLSDRLHPRVLTLTLQSIAFAREI
jgi:hypothetical protein